MFNMVFCNNLTIDGATKNGRLLFKLQVLLRINLIKVYQMVSEIRKQ